jgi:hypothetical protein
MILKFLKKKSFTQRRKGAKKIKKKFAPLREVFLKV